MSNPGGKLTRSIVPPETVLIDHESRIKILERGTLIVTEIVDTRGGSVLWGIGPPPISIGNNNDWYLDVSDDDNWVLYGPKSDASWGDKQNLGGGINWRGVYSNSLSYKVDDGVFYDGSSYRALVDMPAGDEIPSFTAVNWALIAQKGSTGSTGPAGITGPIGLTGPVGINWMGDWDHTIFYFINDGVYYQGSSYRALGPGTDSTPPDAAPLRWKVIALAGASGGGGVAWRGAWVSGTIYAADDGVTYAGSSYRRLIDGDGTTVPSADTTNWELIAAKGDTGATGPTGTTGSAGPAGIDWKGVWNAGGFYTLNDGVYYNGTSYRRVGSGGIFATPPDVDTTHWFIIAQKGTDGVSPTPLWNWRGVWSSSTDYLTGDLVETQGSTYYAPVDIAHGSNPASPGAPWELVAQRGLIGNTGSTGPTGPQGPAGLRWMGTWSASTPYLNNDAVTYLGTSYRRQIGGTTSTPPNSDITNWEIIASKGDAGPTGSTGPQGPAGSAGGITARRVVSFTTASLAAQATTTSDVTINLAASLYKMAVNRPARVRAYGTAAYRSADATRTTDTDPTGDHGLLAEVLFATGLLSITFAPVTQLVNMDGTPITTIYFAIQNLDTATGTITVDLTIRQDE